MKVTRRSLLAHYGFAVICVAAAVIARWFLNSEFGDRVPFITFFPAVMIAAYFGGLGPGLLATVLSVFSVAYFWLPPTYSFSIFRPADWIALTLFILVMLTISALSEALHSAKRRAEQSAGETIAQEQRYHSIVETAREGIWIVDAEAVITFVNPRLTEMLGYTVEEMIGRQHYNFIFDEDQQAAHERFQTRMQGETKPLDFRFRRRDGSEVWASVSATKMYDSQEDFAGLLSMLTDITDRKQAEQERTDLLRREQAARQEAELANRLKDEFFAALSHELRTPLNAIIGWSQMIANGKCGPDMTAQGIGVIQRNAKVQAQLIEDLLDVSRIIAGKIQLETKPVALPLLIDATVDSLRPMADAKGIELIEDFAPLVGEVIGDATRLQQIVLNLLTNAIKFTPTGGRVGIKVEEVGSEIKVIVSDTGQGIRADFLPHIFERFRQADSSYKRTHSGLGLGLAIVWHLVELHGGKIEAHSEGAGKGSTFVVTLPLSKAVKGNEYRERGNQTAADDASANRHDALAGVRLLIVDDHADTREMLAAGLKAHGAEVATACSVAEALRAIEAGRTDVLISDIGMPEEDGYDLITRVRSLPPEWGGLIPAIALTGYAGSEEGERALRAGFQVHLAKPTEPIKLVVVIATLTGRGGKGQGA